MPRVLIVESDQDTSMVLCDALALTGINGIAVGREQPAGIVMAASAVQPDVILLDLMPWGIAVARALREHGFSQTPIIATTTSPRVARKARGLDLFADVMEKPFELDDLLLSVSQALPDARRAISA